MSAPLRLPDFVVAGVPRAGTTTVATHLRAMPEVFLPGRKEVHHFTSRHRWDVARYAAHYTDARPTQVCGDVTPSYLLQPEAVRALARTLPEAVVVVVLRDPVDRAYSHYWHNQWKGIELLGFEDALAAEPERLRADPSNSPVAYVGSGEYARLLRGLHEDVPPERVHVMLFDDLVADPGTAMGGLCRRIGVAPPSSAVVRQRTNHHGPVRSAWLSSVARRLPGPACRVVRRWNTSPGEYPAMAPGTRQRLAQRFAADQADLARLLGRELPWSVGARG